VGSWAFTGAYSLACNQATSVVYVSQVNGGSTGLAVFNSISSFTTPSSTWSSYPSYPFYSVEAAAVNPTNGNVYVMDNSYTQVFEFTSAGSAVNLSQGFTGPTDVETDSLGNFYVVDSGVNTLYKINSSMAQLNSWTAVGGHSFTTNTSAVALDSSNNIYVADTAGIWEMSSAGVSIASWTLPSSGFITQMAVNPSGAIFAADNGTGYVDEYIPGTSTYKNRWTGSTTGGGTNFTYLWGICLLPGGNLLTSDNSGNLLQEYAP